MALLRQVVRVVVTVAVAVVAMQLVTLPRAGSPQSDEPRRADVLARIEVRGSSAAPTTGRSSAPDASTPGPSSTDTPDTPTAAPVPTETVEDFGAPVPGPPAETEPTLDVAGDGVDTVVAARTMAATAQLEERGAEALDLIGYDWQRFLPGWTIAFEPQRVGLRGLTFTGDLRIEIYVRDGDDAQDIARVVAHELGHAIDISRNEVTDRRLWRGARGLDEDLAWWPDSGAADFASGAGDFAECAATWMVGSATLSQVGGDCTPDQLGLVATLATG